MIERLITADNEVKYEVVIPTKSGWKFESYPQRSMTRPVHRVLTDSFGEKKKERWCRKRSCAIDVGVPKNECGRRDFRSAGSF